MSGFIRRMMARGRHRPSSTRLGLFLLMLALPAGATALVVYRLGGRPLCTPKLSGLLQPSIPAATPIPITGSPSLPRPEDWIDYGPVLEAGAEGAWDYTWGGLTPVSAVRRAGLTYFYYVAADGYRSFDGGPRHRAIGLATSPDGIHFTKSAGNPVLTHGRYDGEEEGANSGGVTLSGAGEFVLFYGAAAGPGDIIVADGRAATSDDGTVFEDAGLALDHCDAGLYGFGDEVFPVVAYEHRETWYVFYEPNGRLSAARTLGVAWGPDPTRLERSARVLDETTGGKPVGAWSNVVWLDADTIALFIQRLWWPNTFIEVRLASPETPYYLSEPVVRYDIPNLKRGAILLDVERRTWFMYVNQFDQFWRLRLAPYGPPDQTPPTAPSDVRARALDHTQVELVWEAAGDPDTGVVAYDVYRDGQSLGRTLDTRYTDVDLSAQQTYSYQVMAINFHGLTGPAATTVFTTPPDSTPPSPFSALAQGSPTQIRVAFDEPLARAVAEDAVSYAIVGGPSVAASRLEDDNRTVSITTAAPLADEHTYILAIQRAQDAAATPNAIASTSYLPFTYSPISTLLGYWRFDYPGITATLDLSGHAHVASLGGATATGDGLRFDGQDDFLEILDAGPLAALTDGSFSFSAWARPQVTPSHPNGYGLLLRVGDHPGNFMGLTYDEGGRYTAHILDATETSISLTSGRIEPSQWSHLVMTVDVLAGSLALYLDGRPVDGSPVSFGGPLLDLNLPTRNDERIGAYYVGSGRPDRGMGPFFTRYFQGEVGEVRLYGRALGLSEVQALYDHLQGGS